MQHTLKPWTIEEYGDDGAPCIVIHSGRHNRICFMATPGERGNAEQIEANAHLIAAAPDLLAACEMFEDAEDKRQHCEECEGEGEPEACGTCFPFFDDARVMRRIAIEKARGRAPKTEG